MTLRSILVPLDGSAFGEHALPHALGLARRAGARLELAHVLEARIYPDFNPATAAEDSRATEAQAREYLDAVAGRVAAVSPVPVSAVLLHGRVGDSLADHIAATRPDLVVLTTHGRGPISRFWLGSVATELVQRAPGPLLLVRPKEGPADLAAEVVPARILVPLDGSPFGEHVLPLAVAVGVLAGAECRLLRVVPPVLIGGRGEPGLLAGGRTMADQLRAEAAGYLAGLPTRFPGLRAAEQRVVADWPPAGAILAEAEATRTDLIALATRGRSGLARLLLGSVADKVVRGATVPVLLRRPEAE